jgi:hypothetical protein
MGILALAVLWLSFWPRLVIDAAGLTIHSLFRRRLVAWREIEAVAVKPDRMSGRDRITLTVAGADLPVPIPGVASFGIGRRYMRQAVEDIEAAWHNATDRRAQP